MITLSAVSKLQAYLDGAAATTNPQVLVNYADLSASGYAAASTVSNLNGTTPVDICASGAGQRDIDYINILNIDTAAVVVNVVMDVSGTDYKLVCITLGVAEKLEYTHGNGWKVLDMSGAVKTVLGTPQPSQYIDFAATSAPAQVAGRLWYDTDQKALSYYNDITGSSNQIGFEQWIRVRNSTGSTIADGSVVYVNGASGQIPTIALADADTVVPTQVIGLVTADIANNAQGLVTTHGIVNSQNTIAYADGSILYLSQTAGQVTNVKPAEPAAAVSVGIVVYSHATNGKIYVSVDDAKEYLTGDAADGKLNSTGIGVTSLGAYTTTLTYNETTRTVTIAPTGASFDVYVQGQKYTKTAQSLAHAATGTSHFFYFDETGTFVTTTTPWNLLAHAPVAFVFQDVTNSRRICFEERHQAGRDVFWHRNQHTNEGTKVSTAVATSGYTLNDGSTNAAVTFGVSSFRLEDEDIRIDTEVFPDAGPYNILKRVGVGGEWQLFRTSTLPFLYTTGQLQYNLDTAGTWSDANVTEDYFVNYWVFGFTSIPKASYTPAPTTTQQVVVIAGQAQHATAALANAESFTAIQWGTIPFQELAPLYQVTLRFNASNPSAYTNTARTAIVAFTRIVGTAATLTAAIQTDHGALAGLLDDDHPQYYLGAGTRAGVANFTSGSITGITDITVADGGTGASTAADARTNLGLGSIATQAASSVAITGGSISGTSISGSTGAFTTLSASGNGSSGAGNAGVYATSASNHSIQANSSGAATVIGLINLSRAGNTKGFVGLNASDLPALIDSSAAARLTWDTNGVAVTGTLRASGKALLGGVSDSGSAHLVQSSSYEALSTGSDSFAPAYYFAGGSQACALQCGATEGLDVYTYGGTGWGKRARFSSSGLSVTGTLSASGDIFSGVGSKIVAGDPANSPFASSATRGILHCAGATDTFISWGTGTIHNGYIYGSTTINQINSVPNLQLVVGGAPRLEVNASTGLVTANNGLEVNGRLKNALTRRGVLSLQSSGLSFANGIKIKTNIPWAGDSFFEIHIHGYHYSQGTTVDLRICSYMYSATGYPINHSATSAGGWAPSITMVNESNLLSIVLGVDRDDGYYLQGSVDVTSINVTDAQLTGWTVVDETGTGYDVPYKSDFRWAQVTANGLSVTGALSATGQISTPVAGASLSVGVHTGVSSSSYTAYKGTNASSTSKSWVVGINPFATDASGEFVELSTGKGLHLASTTGNAILDGTLNVGATSVTGALSATGSSIKAIESGGQLYGALQVQATSSGGNTWTIASNATSSALGAAGSLSFRDSTAGTTHMTLDASGNLLVGTTSAAGDITNTKDVVGGVFKTKSGTVITTHSTAATMFTVPTGLGVYLVTAMVDADTNVYSETALVTTQGGSAVTVTTLQNGANISITNSGYAIQVTQTSGGGQTATYSAIRIM